MAKKRVTVQVCDNPTCAEQYIDDGSQDVPGFHLGKGYWVSGGGGPIPATYACSRECVVPAIDANIDRGLGRDPLSGYDT